MVNSVHLIGRLGQDPELRYTPTGKAVCNFSLATDGYGKDAPPDWHNIVAWEKTAENVKEYLHKGSLVFIGGRIQTDKYADKTHPDIMHYRAKIVAHTVKFLDGKKSDGGKITEGQAPPALSDDDLPF